MIFHVCLVFSLVEHISLSQFEGKLSRFAYMINPGNANYFLLNSGMKQEISDS